MNNTAVKIETFTAQLVLHPRRIKHWLDTLPLTELDQTARAILYALECIKGHRQLSARVRFRALETMAPFLSMLLPSLAVQYSGKPLPLAERDRHSVELSTALQLELIHGYQQVLTDSSRVYLLGWRKLVTTTIHRLFRYRSNILCNYRICYLPYPPGVWKQIYWFFQLVEENGLAGKRVSDPLVKRKRTSIEFEFKRLLLLSILSPHHFAGSSIDEVYAHLDIWVAKAQIRRPAKGEDCSNSYRINLQGDQPPQLDFESEQNRNVDCCLDTSALVEELRGYLDSNEPGSPVLKTVRGLTLSRQTLKKLLLGWNRADYRRSDRLSTQERVEISVGIDSIHNALNTVDKPTENKPLLSATLPAYLIDFSNKGFCLSVNETKCERLQLDDLVALKTASQNQWRLGQVRWMQSNGKGRVRLGVMLLSSHIVPGQVVTPETGMNVNCVLGMNRPHPVVYFSAEFGPDYHAPLALQQPGRQLSLTLQERFASSSEFDAYYIELAGLSSDNRATQLNRRKELS